MIKREDLYALAWSKPMTQVAKQFGVSDSYMTRVCSVLGVPRPGAGHWAKAAVGRAPPPKPLPPARPGDPLYWSKGGDLRPVLLPKPSITVKRDVTKGSRRRKRVSGIHELLRDAKGYFESGRAVEEGQYLRPYKKLLLDVTTSKASLDKTLALANDLYNALESAGHRVVLAPHCEQLRRTEIDEHEEPRKKRHYSDHARLWSPLRPTLVDVGSVAIGLSVVEMSERVVLHYVRGKYVRDSDYVAPKAAQQYVGSPWTTTKDLPCGRLRLIAYWPYWPVSWSIKWQETKKTSLKRDLPAIVKAIEAAAVELAEKLEEADRQAEIRRLERLAEEERRRQEEDRRQVEESIKESREELAGIIHAWGEAMDVARFLKGVEERAGLLAPEERSRVLERLKLAREFLGTLDPMEIFLEWKPPLERYRPMAMQVKHSAVEEVGE